LWSGALVFGLITTALMFLLGQIFYKMKTELNKLILHLRKDEIRNISVIGFIENNPITEIVEIIIHIL